MLYFKALLDGLDAMPAADPAGARRAAAQAAEHGLQSLHDELRAGRPDHRSAPAAGRLVKRIQRALEVWRVGGRPLSEHHGLTRAPAGPRPPLIAPRVLRPGWLHARIEQRFRRMLTDGLVDEVRGAAGGRGDLTPDLPSMRCASATGRPGTQGLRYRLTRWPSAALPPPASLPSSGSRPGCVACPSGKQEAVRCARCRGARAGGSACWLDVSAHARPAFEG